VTLSISTAPLWVTGTNCYLAAASSGGPAVIIDAPPDASAIKEMVRRAGVRPVALLLTHGHVDHVGGAGAVVKAGGVAAYLHPTDFWLIDDLPGQMRMLMGSMIPGDYERPSHLLPLAHDQVLELAGLSFRVIHTPGHTEGHCCFMLDDEGVLFSGDHLFAGSIGRTDLPGGSEAALMKSMAERVAVLPAATRVLSGHGPATTLARELATNPFLQV
jgi:hydroxyacylglutathione hydrolase